jgi:toxin CcdB
VSRFTLFANPDGEGYLLDLQADLFDHLETRVVVPLLPAGKTPPPVKRLHPIFEIEGKRFVMATPLMAAFPTHELREARGNLSQHHYEIVSALDMLFQGY